METDEELKTPVAEDCDDDDSDDDDSSFSPEGDEGDDESSNCLSFDDSHMPNRYTDIKEFELKKKLQKAADEMHSEMVTDPTLIEKYPIQINEFAANGFGHRVGYLSGHKTGMKFTPEGFYVFWVTYTGRVGAKHPPYARRIRRWVSIQGDSDYEYFTWCGIVAGNKEFQKDINDRMDQKLQDLAKELSFQEAEYWDVVGY